MAKTASILITMVFVVVSIMLVVGAIMDEMRWQIVKSPTTETCYEIRSAFWAFSMAQAMSPVDDKYCDEKKGIE